MKVWTLCLRAEWEGNAHENAKAMAQDFRHYLEAHRDKIEALTIFYAQPHRRGELSYAMIREILDKLRIDKPRLAPLRVWQAYVLLDDYKGQQPASELTALVALIRRVCGIDATISPYSDTVRRNFQNWIMTHHSGGGEKFNEEQMAWLRMIPRPHHQLLSSGPRRPRHGPVRWQGRHGANVQALRRSDG